MHYSHKNQKSSFNKTSASSIATSWKVRSIGQLRVTLCEIRVILKGRGHGTSPIWLKFCIQSCFGLFQSSGKFYFGRSEHGRFRSALKGNQYGGSEDFLSSFRPAYHNVLPVTINTLLTFYGKYFAEIKSFGHERAKSCGVLTGYFWDINLLQIERPISAMFCRLTVYCLTWM